MSLASMPTTAVNSDAGHWQQWEHRYQESSRKSAFQARIAFAVLLTATVLWLGRQLLTMPL